MEEVICKKEMSGGIFLHYEYEPVQDLVRCKDCKWQDEKHACEQNNIWAPNDFFCAYGERRKTYESM